MNVRRGPTHAGLRVAGGFARIADRRTSSRFAWLCDLGATRLSDQGSRGRPPPRGPENAWRVQRPVMVILPEAEAWMEWVAFPLTVTPVTIAFPLVTVVIEYAPRGTAMSIEPLRVVPARWRRALLRSNVRSPVSVL